MPEQIQNIINRILDWWRAFTNRQKILIVSIAAVVIVAFVVLFMVMNQPKWVSLYRATNTAESAEVKQLLDDNGINYNLSTDALSFSVEEKDITNARIILGSNSIPSTGFGLDEVFNGSFTATESENNKKYLKYKEQQLEDHLKLMSFVKDASVALNVPENDGTIITQNLQSSARVILTLNNPINAETAAGVANFIATGLGNKGTENIFILDSNGNVLFSGASDNSAAGIASTNLSIRDKVRETMATDVRNILMQTNLYDSVEVGMNLVVNFDQKTETEYRYWVEEGLSQGYLDSRYQKNSESTSGSGGVPGTYSNQDDSTYVTDNGQQNNTSTSEIQEDFLPNETITQIVKEVGAIDYDTSSVTVACTSYVVYSEDDLNKNGTLKNLDVTFDEFVATNSDRVKLEVDQDIVNAVANATGIARDRISVVAYEVPMFQYSSGSSRTITDYLEIILAVLIFALLGFVVFRSLRTEQEEEVQEEVSIEELITATQEESELEDIGFNEKSEARILIEKFVDEKPEAAASLLRNWLNEDWG